MKTFYFVFRHFGRFLKFLVLFLFTALPSLYGNEISQIKKNYIQQVLVEKESEQRLVKQLCVLPKESCFADQTIVELMERYPIEEAHILELLAKIEKKGSWVDIDYTDQDRSGWLAKKHPERILELVKAYSSKKSSLYNSSQLLQAIHKTLDYWFTANLISLNWWHNQIGVPKTLGAIGILFEDKLTALQKENLIKYMANAKFGMTGQNKVWLAGNVLVRGLLQNDLQLVKAARDTIVSEIKIGYGQNEGVKLDNSFHQHGAQQQFANYGAAFISTISFWAQTFENTSLVFDQFSYDILSDLINKGYLRILWKGYMDINALGRQFYHQTQKHKPFSVAFSANGLAETDSKNRKEYMSLIDENIALKFSPQLRGQYHFWKSDQTVHRTANWMASLKMASSRVIGAESGNGDNQLGYYVADGACYTYVDGNEYENIFPCWDWRKIPGVTAYETNKPLKKLSWNSRQNTKSFVGNVNDGYIGITSMDFLRDGLSAKKSYVFTDDYVFCLGAAIKADSGCVVTTTVEQCVANTDLLQYKEGKWASIESGLFEKGKHQRLFLNKTGYIILGAEGKALVEEKEGRWHDVMNIYPKDMTESKKVVSIYLDHGIDPQGASYQYFILPARNAAEIADFDTSKLKVISNTAKLQAISLSDEIYLLTLYAYGNIQLTQNLNFSSNKPGLFILKKRNNKLEIIASDPTCQEDSFEILINGKKETIILPSGELKGTKAKIITEL